MLEQCDFVFFLGLCLLFSLTKMKNFISHNTSPAQPSSLPFLASIPSSCAFDLLSESDNEDKFNLMLLFRSCSTLVHDGFILFESLNTRDWNGADQISEQVNQWVILGKSGILPFPATGVPSWVFVFE